ncbi:MAG: tetratricopeptide repeat protein [Anaerolineae bacterium]|nr:tetratricopeptide repeat protein [Anaerolineae bacterium]
MILVVLIVLVGLGGRRLMARCRALILLLRARRRVESDDVLRLLDRVIALYPDLALAYVLRSQALYRRGNDEAALTDADHAVRLAPRSDRSYRLRATLYDYLGKYHEAIRDLQSAIFYNPNWFAGYLDLALHYLALDEPVACIKVLEALGCRAGTHPLHYNALVMAGLVYEENLRDFDEAIRLYSRAIELMPERRVAHLMRGWALRTQGEYQAAALDLLRASRCPRPSEDESLYGWLQAQYDPWLYLVAHSADDRNAWLNALRHSELVGARPGAPAAAPRRRSPGRPQIYLN